MAGNGGLGISFPSRLGNEGRRELLAPPVSSDLCHTVALRGERGPIEIYRLMRPA